MSTFGVPCSEDVLSCDNALLLDSVFRVVTDALIVCDEHWRCKVFSYGFEQLVKLPGTSLVGRTLREIAQQLGCENSEVDRLPCAQDASPMNGERYITIRSASVGEVQLKLEIASSVRSKNSSSRPSSSFIVKLQAARHPAASISAAVQALCSPALVIDFSHSPSEVVTANTAFCNTTGYGLADLQQLPFKSVHAATHDFSWTDTAAVVGATTLVVVCKNGSRRTAQVQYSAVEGAGHHVLVLYHFSSTPPSSQAPVSGPPPGLDIPSVLEVPSVLDDSKFGCWLAVHDGPVLQLQYTNSRFGELLACPKENLVGKDWDFWKDRVVQSCGLQALHESMLGGLCGSAQVGLLLPNGSHRLLQLFCSPLRVTSGQKHLHLGFAVDLTQGGVNAVELQLMADAFKASQLAISILDTSIANPSIMFCNRAFELLSGYNTKQIVGRSWAFLNGTGTDAAQSTQIHEALARGRTAIVEIVQHKVDGSKFWDQVCVSPILDSSGHPTRAVMIQQDITERKAAEAGFLLRDHALSNLSEGISIADPNLPDSPIIYVNDAFLRITGYSKEDVLGRNCRFLQGPDTDPEAVHRIHKAIHAGHSITEELVNYRKTGEKFWNLLSITPVKDRTGKLISLIGVQSNISELMQRKEAEKNLLEAKIAAEMATEAKSMFLANMSHEIRTPLNGMIATAQLLLASNLSPEQQELTETLLDSGNTLLGILGDILDFSKIDHGSVELQQEPVFLQQTIEACLEIVAADACKKGLELAYLIEPRAAKEAILGDTIRIRQVLVNILSNAVKFTERGEVVVHVMVEDPTSDERSACTTSATLKNTPAADLQKIHIKVRDTGIGISEASTKKLFQCFRQGHESMSRKYGGTGLGLVISKRLAELMSGTIWVESVPGLGATFHFTMLVPWSKQGQIPPEEPAAAPQASLFLQEGGSSNEVLTSVERQMLQERVVLVDVAHESTSAQVCQSCAQLGMRATAADALQVESRNFEMAIVGVEKVAAAVRAGWKGRPLVALGRKENLPLPLHPLVIFVSRPVKHSKLAAALVNSTSLLKWRSNRAPRLTSAPINVDAFSIFKGWRRRDSSAPALSASSQQAADDEVRRISLDNSALERPMPVSRMAGTSIPPGASNMVGPNMMAYPSRPSFTGRGPYPSRGPPTGSNAAQPSSSMQRNQSTNASVSAGAAARLLVEGGRNSLKGPVSSLIAANVRRSHDVLMRQQDQSQSHDPQTSTTNAAPSTPSVITKAFAQSTLNSTSNHGTSAWSSTTPAVISTDIGGKASQSGGEASAGSSSTAASDADSDQHLRILVAEDNKINQKVVLKVLQRLVQGVQPVVVENGFQVLAALERQVYDIILMDIHMPDMDGLEASKRICAQYQPEERPKIVALSADTLQVLHERCKDAGITEFITKPFRVEDLQRVMSTCTRVKRHIPPNSGKQPDITAVSSASPSRLNSLLTNPGMVRPASQAG